MGQTVNLLAYAFGGSNPSLPTLPTQRHPVVASVLFLYMAALFRAERREQWPRSGGGAAQRLPGL